MAIPDFGVSQQGFADIGKKRAKKTFLLYKRKKSLAFAKLYFFAEREASLTYFQVIGAYALLCMSLGVIIISKMQDVW